ncbi:FtsX-like permease family protein [Streptomyces sp. NPDC017979]|uniref:FtsX-like permease family protein n=1 Tax=Streptomyces sp. NPDC017979 TaxID=3365024 RepID=UPI0037A239D6
MKTSLAFLRERRTAFVGAFTALCLGAAILTTSALILLSGGSGVPERYAGTPVLVQSGPLDPVTFHEAAPFAPGDVRRLARDLAALPGVRVAVPDRSFYAQAVDGARPLGDQRAGDRLGHGWSSAALAPYRLITGRAPRTADEVAVDRSLGLATGARTTLLTADGPVPFTVSGTVDGPGYYLTDARAAELSAGVRVVGLRLAEGADAAAVAAGAARVVGDAGRVLRGDGRADLAPGQDEETRWIGGQVVSAMTGLSAFVTVFVVSSAFAFTVLRRRREFGLLRTIGATPRQVRRTVYVEGLVVGAVAAAAGTLLGTFGAPVLGDVLVDAGFQPRGFAVVQRPWASALAFLAGVAIAFAGVWTASRRAARIRPMEALREAAVDDRPLTAWRRNTGLAFVALGVGAAVGTASAAPSDMMTFALVTAVGLITGTALLMPALVPPLVRLATRPLRGARGATVALVRAGMLAAVRRTSSTVAPVLATVAFTVLITVNTATSAQSYADRDVADVTAAATVVPAGTPGLTDAEVRRITGSPILPTVLHAGPGRTPVEAVGVDPTAYAAVHGLSDGDLAALTEGDGAVVVARSALAAFGARAGASVPVTFEDGTTRTLRIAAVVDDRELPHAAVLSRALVRAHDPAALTAAVHRTGPPVEVRGGREITVEEFGGRDAAAEDRLVRVFTLLLVALSAGYTGIAVAGTLLMSTADRLPDLRILRRSGATVRQVLGALAAESALVVAIGTVLGALVALPSLLGIRAGLSGTLGIPVDLVVPWPPILATVAATLLLAQLATVLPAARSLRTKDGAPDQRTTG